MKRLLLPVANQQVSIRAGILLGSPEREALYYEIHHLQTNQFDLADLVIIAIENTDVEWEVVFE